MKKFTIYTIYINGDLPERTKTFKRGKRQMLNATWSAFNKYAKGKGYTEAVESSAYFGALAWKHPGTGAVMELREANEELARILTATAPIVSTTIFERAHGKMPKGEGLWGFYFNGDTKIENVFWAKATQKYSTAKREAITEAKRRGVTFISVAS